MNGFLVALKPPGMTSHDVVGFIRRTTGAKVGHTGTLDPLAAGVLVLALGSATRLAEYLSLADKVYRAEIILGLETATYDLEGEVLARNSAVDVSEAAVRVALAGLTGALEMLPPMYSAVKQGGRKLYDLARAGQEVERRPRPVHVAAFDLLEFTPGEEARCLCHVGCSKGTYVRSLAQMLGEALGCGGCLGFLLRTRQGTHRIEDALTLEEIAALATAGDLARALISPLDALPADMPRLTADDAQAGAMSHGNAVPLAEAWDVGQEAWQGACQEVAVVRGGQLLCLARVIEQSAERWLQPTRVFAG
jgi:tRNA pseudouridine55 synthase